MSDPAPSLLLKKIGLLVTLNKDLGTIKDAAVFSKGSEIIWVGKTGDLPAKYADADVARDLPDRILIPGLVNTHHHMFQCLTRCVAQVSICRLVLLNTNTQRFC